MTAVKSLPFTVVFAMQELLEKAGMPRAEAGATAVAIEKSEPVQRELRMPGAPDPAGITEAVGSASYGFNSQVMQALTSPRARLAIMGAVNAMDGKGSGGAALLFAMLER